jgi:hypothetical protein
MHNTPYGDPAEARDYLQDGRCALDCWIENITTRIFGVIDKRRQRIDNGGYILPTFEGGRKEVCFDNADNDDESQL